MAVSADAQTETPYRGKIMRRVLKAVALDRDPGDITTIEDEGSVEEAREALADLQAAIPDGS